MDIDSLNIFIDTSQTLNFSQTARRLHISQSTVSKHIQNLENQLNVILFERNKGRLSLTQAGKALIPWARQLVNECDRFQRMAQVIQKDVAGPLIIACTTSAGKYVLPLLAARFQERFPNVKVSMLACHPQDVEDVLHHDEADLAVVSYETTNPDMECQIFFYDEIRLITAPDHPLTQLDEIHPESILQSKMIIREPTSGTLRTMLSKLAAHDISLADLNVILELGNAEAIVNAVAANLGIAFVSRTAANFALEAGRVTQIKIPDFKLKRKICMLRKKFQSPTRTAEVFWHFIHEPEIDDLIQATLQD